MTHELYIFFKIIQMLNGNWKNQVVKNSFHKCYNLNVTCTSFKSRVSQKSSLGFIDHKISTERAGKGSQWATFHFRGRHRSKLFPWCDSFYPRKTSKIQIMICSILKVASLTIQALPTLFVCGGYLHTFQKSINFLSCRIWVNS